jgi:hypothetical protein
MPRAEPHTAVPVGEVHTANPLGKLAVPLARRAVPERFQ